MRMTTGKSIQRSYSTSNTERPRLELWERHDRAHAGNHAIMAATRGNQTSARSPNALCGGCQYQRDEMQFVQCTHDIIDGRLRVTHMDEQLLDHYHQLEHIHGRHNLAYHYLICRHFIHQSDKLQ